MNVPFLAKPAAKSTTPRDACPAVEAALTVPARLEINGAQRPTSPVPINALADTWWRLEPGARGADSRIVEEEVEL